MAVREIATKPAPTAKKTTASMASSPCKKGRKKIIAKVIVGIINKSNFSIHRLVWANISIPKITHATVKLTIGDFTRLKRAIAINAPSNPLNAAPPNNSTVENAG